MRSHKRNEGSTFRVATFNIHRCIGTDSRRRPERIGRVLQEMRADVIGLQEVESPGLSRAAPLVQMDFLAGWAGMEAVPGPTMFREEGLYGNVLLSRFEVIKKRTWDISVPGREPRGIIDAVVRAKQELIRVLVTHFGLNLRERRNQAEKLVSLVFEKKEMTTILLGDINGWHPFGGALWILRKGFGRIPAPPTFPSRFPLLPLDRIWLHRGNRQVDIRIRRHRTPLSRMASDHLPVTADIRLQDRK